MRNLSLLVWAMLLLALSVRLSSAAPGAADGVASKAIVVPMICSVEEVLDCEAPDSQNQNSTQAESKEATLGGMNTLLSIANVGEVPSSMSYTVYDAEGNTLLIKETDTISNSGGFWATDCQSIVQDMDNASKCLLKQEIGGEDYYVFYAIFEAQEDTRFVAWSYLVDMANGMAASLVPFHAEGGVDPETLAEEIFVKPMAGVEVGFAVTSFGVEAGHEYCRNNVFQALDVTGPMGIKDRSVDGLDVNVDFNLYFRYALFTEQEATDTWLIILRGNAQCAVQDPNTFQFEEDPVSYGEVDGLLCDESDEECVDIKLDLSRRLTVVSVKELLEELATEEETATEGEVTADEQEVTENEQEEAGQQNEEDQNEPIKPDFPVGYVVLKVPKVDCSAQANGAPYLNIPASFLGWSYSRAQGSDIQASWGVIFPALRD